MPSVSPYSQSGGAAPLDGAGSLSPAPTFPGDRVARLKHAPTFPVGRKPTKQFVQGNALWLFTIKDIILHKEK